MLFVAQIRDKFGRQVETFFVILTSIQFHFLFYCSRPLPNILALGIGKFLALIQWILYFQSHSFPWILFGANFSLNSNNTFKGFSYVLVNIMVKCFSLFICSEFGVWILVPGPLLCRSKLFGMYVILFYFSFILGQIFNFPLLAFMQFFPLQNM